MGVTYLELKTAVANRSGRNDGATANTIRDNAINNVIRFTIANAAKFSWLETETTLALDSNGEADLPANFNPTHGVKSIIYGDTPFTEINQEDFQDYEAGGNVYYVDYNTSTNRYRVVSTQKDISVDCVYWYVPAALSSDSDTTVVPDPWAIIYLASAWVWLARERDEANHDRDQGLGIMALNKMKLMDKRANPTRSARGSIYSVDLGFNRPD